MSTHGCALSGGSPVSATVDAVMRVRRVRDSFRTPFTRPRISAVPRPATAVSAPFTVQMMQFPSMRAAAGYATLSPGRVTIISVFIPGHFSSQDCISTSIMVTPFSVCRPKFSSYGIFSIAIAICHHFLRKNITVHHQRKQVTSPPARLSSCGCALHISFTDMSPSTPVHCRQRPQSARNSRCTSCRWRWPSPRCTRPARRPMQSR